MNERAGRVALFLVLALALAACATPGDGGRGNREVAEGINVGNLARDFELESLDGETVALSDFRGQVVLVNFWASWCAPCRAEIPDIEVAYHALRNNGFVVLGVNVEEPAETISPFVEEMDMTYPVVLDPRGELMRVYRVPGLPMSVFVDREGIIRARHTGYLSDGQLNDYLADLMPAGEASKP